MRGLKRNPWLFGLGLLAIPVWFGGQAQADINNDQAGSLVIFPKVIADGSRDTVIKITNKSNMPAYAHCYYTNALGSCALTGADCTDDGDCTETGDSCNTVWVPNNFDIFLTAQQPTFWRVSTGRFGDLLQPACTLGGGPCACEVNGPSGALECPGFDAGAAGGINSIAIAGTGTDFVGELRCYQTMDDQTTPVGQNSLVGEAIIETLATGQISTYDAVHVTGVSVNTDNDLVLDNAEYNACPEQLIFASHGEGASASIAGQSVSFSTELTLVPCTALYAFNTPVTASVNIFAYDEMELRLSADGVPVGCFSNNRLDDVLYGGIFDATLGDRDYLKTRIVVDDSDICLTGTNAGATCTDNDDCPGYVTTDDGVDLGCEPSPGVIGVVEEFYSVTGAGEGHAAWSLTQSGSRSASDIIVIADPSGNP